MKKVGADGRYPGEEWYAEVKAEYGIRLEVIQKPEGVKGFIAQAKRWLVERTFGWFIQSRRLAREYEKLAQSSEAMMYLSMIRILVRRLA